MSFDGHKTQMTCNLGQDDSKIGDNLYICSANDGDKMAAAFVMVFILHFKVDLTTGTRTLPQVQANADSKSMYFFLMMTLDIPVKYK